MTKHLFDIADTVELKGDEYHASIDTAPYGFVGLITFIGNVHQAEGMAETIRRMKAAVNACTGIPTEALEMGAVDSAFSACREFLEAYPDPISAMAEDTERGPFDEVSDAARSALALVKP